MHTDILVVNYSCELFFMKKELSLVYKITETKNKNNKSFQNFFKLCKI